jgi:hypothetical protein
MCLSLSVFVCLCLSVPLVYLLSCLSVLSVSFLPVYLSCISVCLVCLSVLFCSSVSLVCLCCLSLSLCPLYLSCLLPFLLFPCPARSHILLLTAMQCDALSPRAIRNARHNCTSAAFNQTCVATCDKGFTRFETTSVYVCNATGNWSGTSNCQS